MRDLPGSRDATALRPYRLRQLVSCAALLLATTATAEPPPEQGFHYIWFALAAWTVAFVGMLKTLARTLPPARERDG